MGSCTARGAAQEQATYELTAAEARVIWGILGQPGGSERDRLGLIRLSPSTYHSIRRRSYTGGWLRDAYIPDPVSFGFSHATFVVARPYAERTREVGSRWAAEPGNVLLWSGTQVVFGVFFSRTEAAATKLRSRVSDSDRVHDAVSVTANLDEAGVPVYFDYSGLWSHLVALPPPGSYPFSLGLPRGDQLDESRRLGERDRLRARALSERLGAPSPTGGSGRRFFGLLGLDRHDRQLLESGRIQHRVMLAPEAIPPFEGRRVDQVVWIGGEILPGIDPLSVLAELRQEHHICPFLFTYERGRLLAAFLGQSQPVKREGPSPVPFGQVVRETLSRSLRRIDVSREGVDDLHAPVSHQYERLLEEPPAPAPIAPARNARRSRSSR